MHTTSYSPDSAIPVQVVSHLREALKCRRAEMFQTIRKPASSGRVCTRTLLANLTGSKRQSPEIVILKLGVVAGKIMPER